MLLPLAIASCGGDDKDEPQTNTTKDPDGTVIVNVTKGGLTFAAGCPIGLGDDYNLSGGGNDRVRISIIGPVKGIGSITETSVHSLNWTEEAAAQVGYGYIFDASAYSGGGFYAVYVDSEIASNNGGVLGYKLKVRKLF